MSVIKVNKTKDYSVMSNYHLRDKNLSLKAKGLLSVMLSLPEDWNYSVSGLVSICIESETAVENALKELKDNGYVIVEKIMPDKTSSGRIEYEYNIYERPQTTQDSENQALEIQGVENHPLVFDNIHTNSLCNTNSSIKTNSLYISNKLNTKELNTNNKKENSIIKEKKHKYGEYQNVVLSDNEYKNLINEFGKSVVDEKIIKLDEYLESNGNKNGYKRFGVVLKRAIKENWFNSRKELRPRNRVDNPNISSEWLDQETQAIFNEIDSKLGDKS